MPFEMMYARLKKYVSAQFLWVIKMKYSKVNTKLVLIFMKQKFDI